MFAGKVKLILSTMFTNTDKHTHIQTHTFRAIYTNIGTYIIIITVIIIYSMYTLHITWNEYIYIFCNEWGGIDDIFLTCCLWFFTTDIDPKKRGSDVSVLGGGNARFHGVVFSLGLFDKSPKFYSTLSLWHPIP